MTPEVVAAYIALGISVIGFFIFCGRLVQRVDTNEKEIDETKTDQHEIKKELAEAIGKQAEEFNDVLKAHVEAEQLRDSKVDVLKEELQTYVKEQIKHEERLAQTTRQTEELKANVEDLKKEVHSVSTDVSKLFVMVEQLVEISKETGQAVKEIAERSRQTKA